VILPPLYHWSPADRLNSIRLEGLRTGRPATTSSGGLEYISLSPDPARAWQLSGAMEWTSEIDEWDLWQVRIAEGDSIQVRSEFGPEVMEIKVRNSIPAERCWYVGRRIR